MKGYASAPGGASSVTRSSVLSSPHSASRTNSLRVAIPTCSSPPRTAPASRFWYLSPASSRGSSTQSVSGDSSRSSETAVPASFQSATRGVTPRKARKAPRATASMAWRKPAQAEAGARDLARKSSTRRQPML